mgnify:CR=1 FL=1
MYFDMNDRNNLIATVTFSMAALSLSSFALGRSTNKPTIESVAHIATGAVVRHKITEERYVVVMIPGNGEAHVVGQTWREQRLPPITVYACELEPE